MARPRFFTIEEAARVLRIGRTAAYAAAKRYRQSGGAEGLPVVQVCGSLRVPGGWLEEQAGGPIDLDDLAVPAPTLAPVPAATTPRTAKARTQRAPRAQRPLPFTG